MAVVFACHFIILFVFSSFLGDAPGDPFPSAIPNEGRNAASGAPGDLGFFSMQQMFLPCVFVSLNAND